ncbi:hypothetical protein LCGC14_2142090 [marine sediment metagenome]|uniref:Nitroreductase domain-containing protein n=1 Tax=marine sediment metagenome TaxID=412755 RepID=A0A0F9EKA9_9ZZZZ
MKMEIQLPKPDFKGTKSLEKCIYERESVRNYKDKEIELEKISQILWASQGKKGQKRTVPSAGATYPLEIYVNIKDKGFFHYNLEKHLLELINKNDLSEKIAEASWNQHFIAKAYVNIIICAEFSKTTRRYGQRGLRYVFMEVGHCAQNIHLEVISLGLTSVPIGAFEDERVKKVLALKNNIEPLYIIPIGYP